MTYKLSDKHTLQKRRQATKVSLQLGLDGRTINKSANPSFGSAAAFNEKFDVLTDPEEVIIDFAESRVVDMSAIEALNKITERYQKAGKKLHLKHLSSDCRKLLKNAEDLIDVNVLEDPTYPVAVDLF